ncbi:MAG: hypothetical protein R3A12_11830 [Ignavibacteria bacterium]
MKQNAFGEIKSRITNKDMKQKLESNIRNLKSFSNGKDIIRHHEIKLVAKFQQ